MSDGAHSSAFHHDDRNAIRHLWKKYVYIYKRTRRMHECARSTMLPLLPVVNEWHWLKEKWERESARRERRGAGVQRWWCIHARNKVVPRDDASLHIFLVTWRHICFLLQIKTLMFVFTSNLRDYYFTEPAVIS